MFDVVDFGTAILFLGMYVDIARKWVLLDFLHFGVLSHIEKVPNELMGVSAASSISVVSNWNPVYLV